MKQKLNFATWWRHFSGQKVVENAIWYTAPPGGDLTFFSYKQR